MNEQAYPVLSITRSDVAAALAAEGDTEFWMEGDTTNVHLVAPESAAKAEAISDDDMHTIARKVGDTLMEGGDYWEAAAQWYHEVVEAGS